MTAFREKAAIAMYTSPSFASWGIKQTAKEANILAHECCKAWGHDEIHNLKGEIVCNRCGDKLKEKTEQPYRDQ